MTTPLEDGPWTLPWGQPQKDVMPPPENGPWLRDWENEVEGVASEGDGPWNLDWENSAVPDLRDNSITFGKSVGAGLESLKQTAGGSLEVFGEIIGNNDVGKYLQDTGESMRKEAIRDAQMYPSPLSFSQDIIDPIRKGNWDDAKVSDWAVDALGRMLPMMGSGVIGGLGGAAVGSRFGGLPGAGIGALGGAYTAMLPINIGEIQNEIKEFDKDADGKWLAVGGGGFNTVLDVMSLGNISRMLLREFTKTMSKNAAKDLTKQFIMKKFGKTKKVAEAAITAATVEGVTEGVQELTVIAAVNKATGQKFDPEIAQRRMTDAVAQGILGGGVFGGGASIAGQFIAPNAKAREAIDESNYVDDPNRGPKAPFIRETPIDFNRDTVNTVIEGLNLPMFTPGKYLGETPFLGRGGQQTIKNLMNTVGGKAAHRFLHYAGTSPAWAQIISRIAPQENNIHALPMGYHEAALSTGGSLSWDLNNIFLNLEADRGGRVMREEDNVALMTAIEDITSKDITYRVWKNRAKEDAKKPGYKDHKTMKAAMAYKDRRNKKGNLESKSRTLEVILPDDMTYSFVKGGHSSEIATAAMSTRKLYDNIFRMAKNAGINMSYRDGYMGVHYNTKSAPIGGKFVSLGLIRNDQLEAHKKGLANENVRHAFIALLVNDKDSNGKRRYKHKPFSFEAAEGIYDTITQNKIFVNERPNIRGYIPKENKEGEYVTSEEGDVELTRAEMTRHEQALANMGMDIKDIYKTVKQTPHKAATRRLFGGGSNNNLHVRRHNNMELSRTLSEIIDPADLMPFRETSPHTIMMKYIQTAAKRIEFAKRFGPRGEVFNSLVRKSVNDWNDARKKDSKDIYAPRNREDTEKAVNHMYDVFDAIQGNYGTMASFLGNSQGARKLQAFIYASSYIRTLPLATLSSLPEPLAIFMRVAPKHFASAGGKTMVSTAKDLGIFLNKLSRQKVSGYKLNQSEIRRAAERMGLVADWAVLERLTESVELGEGLAQKATARWFRINLNDQWTKLTRVWAFEAGRQMIIDNVKRLQNVDLNSNTKTRLERELRALGVNINEADQWYADTFGDRQKTHAYLDKIDLAASRMVHEVIMSPNPANRPLWMSNPAFHLFAQLKGFQTTFFNTVVKQMAQSLIPHKQRVAKYTDEGVFIETIEQDYFTQKNARIVMMVFTMLMVASFADTLKNYVKFGQGDNPYRKEIFGPEATLFNYWKYIFEKIALTGPMQFAADSANSQKFGGEPLITLLGPSAGWANDLIKSGNNLVDYGKEGVRPTRSWYSRVAKLLPLPIGAIPQFRESAIDTFVPEGWVRRD